MTATQAGKIAGRQVQNFGLIENIYAAKTKEIVCRVVDFSKRKAGMVGIIISPRGAEKVAFFTLSGRCKWIW